MKLKKILAIMMAASMAAAMAACGGNSQSASDSGSGSESNTEESPSSESGEGGGQTYTIGICQQMEHDALDQATQGFMDACNELFGEGNVEFDQQNAQGEQAMCSTIINNFVSSDVDLILANATLPLQTAAQATADIPILGTSVTDYATALGIDDWTGATGVNISGTSDLAPIDQQEAMLKELLPDTQKVGILYCSAEPNSQYQAQLFEEALEADGIAYEEYTAADSNEIQTVVNSAIETCDALYIPTDNTMASNTQIVNNICMPAKIPVIAGEQGICSGCGIATLSISYYDIGYTAGEMAYQVLAEGADITTMEIQTAPEVTKMYNPTICEELGIEIPEDYTAIETE